MQSDESSRDTICNDADTVQAFAQITDKVLKVEESISDVGCFLPGLVKWSDYCAYLVAAGKVEGKDVPGSASVVDCNNEMRKPRGTRLAGFHEFDGMAYSLRANR